MKQWWHTDELKLCHGSKIRNIDPNGITKAGSSSFDGSQNIGTLSLSGANDTSIFKPSKQEFGKEIMHQKSK